MINYYYPDCSYPKFEDYGHLLAGDVWKYPDSVGLFTKLKDGTSVSETGVDRVVSPDTRVFVLGQSRLPKGE